MEKWNDLIKKLFSRKYAANILVLLALAVIALIVSGDFFSFLGGSRQQTSNPLPELPSSPSGGSLSEEEQIEQRLKRILEEIKGVGEAEIMLTFEVGTEIVPARDTVESKDTTQEEDANGGTRQQNSESITTNTVISSQGAAVQEPMVLKEIKPQVKGVVVVAAGADSPEVKLQIYEAVKTVLQIPGHRVQVFPKN